MKSKCDNAALKISVLSAFFLSSDAFKFGGGIDSASQKVVDLLKNVKEEVGREGKVEDTQFNRYGDFCRKTVDEQKYSIRRSAENIKKLDLLAKTLKADAEVLDFDVEKAAKSIVKLDERIKAATETREKEKAVYDKEAEELNDAIAALYKATKELEEGNGFLQGSSKALSQVSSVVSDVLDTVSLKGQPSESNLQELLRMAPKPGADYKLQKGDVINVLQGTRAQFKETKHRLDVEEMEAHNAFLLEVGGLQNEKRLKNQEVKEKTLESSKKKERKGMSEKSKVDEEQAKEANDAFLAELEEDCKVKAAQHEQRSEARAVELQALDKAIDFLAKGLRVSLLSSTQKVVGAKTKSSGFLGFITRGLHRMGLLTTAPSLLQLSSDVVGKKERKAAELLEKISVKHRDSSVAALALKIRTSNPDQGGTVSLLKDLISQLEAEGKAADKKHEDCTTEIAKASQDVGVQGRKYDTLVGTDDQKSAEIREKASAVAALGKEIAALKLTLQEATFMRTKEKAENEVSLATAKEGSEACKMAVGILSEFYSGVALVQGSAKGRKAPDSVAAVAPKFTVEDGDYKGSVNGNNIVAEVQKLKDTLDAEISTTETDESQSEGDFEKLKDETGKTIEAKETEISDAQSDSETLQVEILKLKEEQADTKDAHVLAQKELEHIKAKCEDGALSFEQQQANRKSEIEDLEGVIKAID